MSRSVPPRCGTFGLTPTQRRPAPNASDAGSPPVVSVEATVLVPGSIAETPPEYWLATQTRWAPVAIAVGPLPTGIVAVTEGVFGSILDTVPSRLLATQRAP